MPAELSADRRKADCGRGIGPYGHWQGLSGETRVRRRLLDPILRPRASGTVRIRSAPVRSCSRRAASRWIH